MPQCAEYNSVGNDAHTASGMTRRMQEAELHITYRHRIAVVYVNVRICGYSRSREFK